MPWYQGSDYGLDSHPGPEYKFAMAKFLKYYAEENRRHPAAHHTVLTRDQMVAATKLLYQAYELPELPIYFSDAPPPGRRKSRGNYSWFSCGKRYRRLSRYISYGADMLTALTVAHEVAHYVRHESYRREVLLPWLNNPALHRPGAGAQPGFGPPRPGHDHDHRHAAVVARALRILREAGFVRPDGVEAIKAAKDRYLKRVGDLTVLDFQALPENAWLPGMPAVTLTGTLEPA